MDFIIIILLFLFSLLVFSIIIQEYVLGAMSGMGLILAGIYVHVNGIGVVNNFVTSALALICIAIGSYVFIRGTMEEAMEQMGG